MMKRKIYDLVGIMIRWDRPNPEGVGLAREDGYMENLENMLRDYMVWNVEILMRNADFKSFLGRNLSLEQTVFRSMWE